MNKANHETPRDQIRDFRQIVNVGPAVSRDLKLLGIRSPGELCGRDPLEMYRQLCDRTGQHQDPCMLDVFIAATDYMNGNPPRKWWEYTEFRKQKYGELSPELEQVGT